ncbi:TadE/TadG family type IV pilus assembly protein [Dyella acidiphila]|uniref:Pilus assembly protein n=1 Tax=Dyella acidiphila TaxID=2775866 RepID=A0ABR9G9W1_9GAMM|nr:TadE/TadG family type IV pilus assembly protein [Dyella acidiphila]MBE1160815.1 pilus assembly protein [Dyella acidiphila]
MQLPPLPHRHHHYRSRRRQHGVVAIEFALVFLLGVLPLLLITLSGVMIFAAQETLTLAAAEGARAALHYGSTAQRESNACNAAQESMGWLLNFSGQQPNCAAPPAPGGAFASIAVSAPTACPSTPAMQCITVVTSYNYNAKPFLPGTKTLYGWVLGAVMSSSATVQLDLTGD